MRASLRARVGALVTFGLIAAPLATLAAAPPASAAGTTPVVGDVILNEVVSANSTYGSGNSDGFELLVLGNDVDLRGLRVSDNELTTSTGALNSGESVIVFGTDSYLSSVKKGTRVWVWNVNPANAAAPLDTDPTDGSLVLAPGTGVTASVDGLGGTVNVGLSTTADALYVYLTGPDGTSAGTDNVYLDFVGIGPQSSNSSAVAPSGITSVVLSSVNGYFTGSTAAASDSAANWVGYTKSSGWTLPDAQVTPGQPNPTQADLFTPPLTAPSVTTQPSSTTISSGASTTLSVVASGTAPLSYQWYQGTSGDTSTPVGTNSASFATPALTSTTSYWVRVSNTAGSSDSFTATVTIASVTNTPPSIAASTANVAVAISDPTNPAVTLTIGDAEDPPAILAVSASSSNAAVIPAANVSLTGTGATRTASVTPTGVGYADVTFRVIDSFGDFATTVVRYASSAASATPSSTRFAAGSSDGSTAVDAGSGYALIGDDENQGLRLASTSASGPATATFDVTSQLGLTDISGGVPREVDVEGSARVGNRIFWIGSQSNSSGGSNRPNRNRVFATDVSGTGAATTLTYAGRYDFLKNDLLAWDQSNGHGLGANALGFAASSATGKAPEQADGSGYNLEGVELMPDGVGAYLAFRAPLQSTVTRDRALVIPVTNFTSLLGGSQGSALFGAPIFLDLGGRAIRELRKNAAGDYLILAGPTATSSATDAFVFYTWTGNPSDAPQLRSGAIPQSAATGCSPEGITSMPSPLTATSAIGIVADCGDNLFYGDGVIAKDLPTNEFKKSRLDTVTLGGVPLRIRDLQGAGHVSPYATLFDNVIGGEFVSGIPGIVTAKLSNGFYLQDPSPDADPKTSEGIFVFGTTAVGQVNVGDSILVNGRVVEFRRSCTSAACTSTSSAWDNLTITEITSPTVTVLSSGNPLPAPVVIGAGGRTPPTTSFYDAASTGNVETGPTPFDPATKGLDFYESLEGMRVQVNNAVASGPTELFGSGTTCTDSGVNCELPVLVDGGAGATNRTARGGARLTELDANPERVILWNRVNVSDTAVPMPLVNVGDTFPGSIQAVVDYSFGNFKLALTAPLPTMVPGGLTKEVTSLTATSSGLTVATFNVRNLDPGDGAAQFNGLGATVVNNLRSPDILTIEEVQDNNGATNNGVVDASTTWTMLIDAITAAGGPTYQYRSINPIDGTNGGEPGGNIRVGFLFNPSRVSFVDKPGGTSTAANTVQNVGGKPALLLSPGLVDPTNSAFNSSRKPLAGEFVFQGQKVFVVANHWNSKGGDDPLAGRFQPPVQSSRTQRNQQAAIVASFVSQITAIDPTAKVVIGGDLNDFVWSPPVQQLATAGFTPLLTLLPQNEQYTYNFDGNAQVLDQLVGSSSVASAAEVDVVHVNSEFYDQLSDHDPVVARISFDTTAPETAIDSAPTGSVSSTSASVTFSSDDPTATFECSTDGGAFQTCTSPLALANLGQGSHSVQVRATDTAGNTDPTPASATWVVDTVPPVPQITKLSVSGSTVTVEFSSNEAGTFTCNVDDEVPTTCTSPAVVPGLADGTHSFTVTATDEAGNSAPITYLAFTVDTVAPETTILEGPPALTNINSAQFRFTSSEAGSSFRCTYDSLVISNCVSPLVLFFLANGPHTFTVAATDPFGNADPTPATYTWTIDGLAPETTIDAAPSGTVASSDATVEFSSNDATASFGCSVDDSAFAVCTSPLQLTGLSDGAHTVQVRAVDPAGNRDATPATASWTVDTAAPTVTITAHPTGSVNTFSVIEFSVDEPASIECTINSEPIPFCSSPLFLSSSRPDGPVTFTVTATDDAGNIGTDTASWTLDTVAPTVTVTVEGTDLATCPAVLKPGATATVTSSEPGSIEVRFTTPSGLTGWMPYTGPFAITQSVFSVEARATDEAGNVGFDIENVTVSSYPDFAVSDSFDRTDGLLGSGWTGATAGNEYRIVGNEVLARRGGGAYRTGALGTSQGASIRLTSFASTAKELGLLLKVQGATPDWQQGAISVYASPRGGFSRIEVYRPDLRTWARYPKINTAFAPGDVLSATVSDSGVVTVYRNCSVVATQTLRTIDVDRFAGKGGAVGMWMVGARDSKVDEFRAG